MLRYVHVTPNARKSPRVEGLDWISQTFYNPRDTRFFLKLVCRMYTKVYIFMGNGCVQRRGKKINWRIDKL